MAFKLRDKQKVRLFCSFCLSLFIFIYLLLTTSAFATGWIYISKTHKPSQEKWSSYESPHGGFNSSSNKCRVCHALHDANKDSYRLLFNNSRLTACDRCHDAVTGLSGKKPYSLGSIFTLKIKHKDYSSTGKNPKPRGITNINEAKGEHTPGAKLIPESNIKPPENITKDGLTCYSCHDPHFAPRKTIQNIERWKNRGLLKDPGDNGSTVERGLISVKPYSSKSKPISKASAKPSLIEIQTTFCSDCHNKMPNWDRGNNERPNKHSHPIGWVDGMVDYYGKKWEVAGPDKLARSCMSCHTATTITNSKGQYTGISRFPHQSIGHKLLSDSYTTESKSLALDKNGGYTGSPYRKLPGLDKGVCRKCHTKVGKDSIEGF